MQNSTACIVLEARSTAQFLGSSLQRHGIRVVTVASVLEGLRLRSTEAPSLWLLGLEEAAAAPAQLSSLMHSEAGAIVPAIAVLDRQPEARRRALGLGLSVHLELPCDDEEVRLVVSAVLGAPHGPARRPITGDLSTVGLSELMTMFYDDGRHVAIKLHGATGTGEVLLHRGDIKRAHTADGARDDDAVEAMLGWHSGTFTAEVGVDPTALSARPASPRPRAPPPPPADATQVAHELLAVLNALYCFVISFVEPAIATRKLEATRRIVAERFGTAAVFEVHEAGMVSLTATAIDTLHTIKQGDLVEATAEWILAFRMDMDQSFPGAIPVGVLRGVADTASPKLRSMGLLRALGVEYGRP